MTGAATGLVEDRTEPFGHVEAAIEGVAALLEAVELSGGEPGQRLSHSRLKLHGAQTLFVGLVAKLAWTARPGVEADPGDTGLHTVAEDPVVAIGVGQAVHTDVADLVAQLPRTGIGRGHTSVGDTALGAVAEDVVVAVGVDEAVGANVAVLVADLARAGVASRNAGSGRATLRPVAEVPVVAVPGPAALATDESLDGHEIDTGLDDGVVRDVAGTETDLRRARRRDQLTDPERGDLPGGIGPRRRVGLDPVGSVAADPHRQVVVAAAAEEPAAVADVGVGAVEVDRRRDQVGRPAVDVRQCRGFTLRAVLGDEGHDVRDRGLGVLVGCGLLPAQGDRADGFDLLPAAPRQRGIVDDAPTRGGRPRSPSCSTFRELTAAIAR